MSDKERGNPRSETDNREGEKIPLQSKKQKKGRPGNNIRQNRQFRQAFAAAGIDKKNRSLMEKVRRCIEHCSRDMRMDLGFHEIRKIAEFMKDSPEKECNCDAGRYEDR